VNATARWQSSPRRLLVDALLVARGTVIGQAPFVLATPLITRLFPVSELGIYGLVLAFVGIAAPVAGLRFELAAISAREPADAKALLLLSAAMILPVTGASMALLTGLKLLDIGLYGVLSWGLVCVTGATIAAAGAYSTLRCWLARRGEFRRIANSLTLQGCLRAGIPVTLAPVAPGADLLIAAELASRLSAIWLMLRKSGLLQILASTRMPASSLRDRLQRFWKYPVLLAPSALIDAAATMVPVPILAAYYGLGPAGKFALVQRLVLLPAALIVGSVGDVFHAHAATVAGQRGDAVGRLVASVAARLLLLALLVYLPVALIAPATAGMVFGKTWADAGWMITLLAPLCIAQTTVSPISRALLLSGREELKLLADFACLALPITTLYLTRREPMIVAVGCFAAAATVAYLIYYAVIVLALRMRPPIGTLPGGSQC
jgi:O-antigen/teichoic acid export membrane protein